MTNVIELFPENASNNNKNNDAEKEFLEYLMWSMRTEQDPHAKFDDPITEFRSQTSSSSSVA